ncbi:MAG: ATP-binding protein [Planctomycetia bacterium]|nr:ATP-binding protein [Planctomycetia bacterium]
MDVCQLLQQLEIGENSDFEFKSAAGGLPRSLWATYSAMANTDGGYIVLGVKEHKGHKEHNGQFEIQGVRNVAQMKRDFWNQVQDRGVVSVNLLSEKEDTSVYTINEKQLFVIHVPRAEHQARPVYIGQNPMTGTYRRFHEGDYKCSYDQVARMLADQPSLPHFDSRLLDTFTEDDIDKTTLQQYRNRFSARNPTHPWLSEDTTSFLQKLGGWTLDRKTSKQGPTVAGVLMFGTEDALQELSKSVPFHLDYRERIGNHIADRWNDRVLSLDGTWTPNLFQFFMKVYPKLTAGLKLPFTYLPPMDQFSDPVRAGMSPVHEALQEALVNALIHADYRGEGGIVIERFADRFEMSNPGTLLVSLEQLYQGSVSKCRNPSLQKMFQMMGAGDKAGSGFDKIRKGWNTQKWINPELEERQKPDRVFLYLRTVSLLPDGFLDKLRSVSGTQADSLNPEEITALAIAYSEGEVSNSKIQQISTMHASDISKMLQKLVSQGLLLMNGYGRWALYRTTDEMQKEFQSAPSLPSNGTSLPTKEETSELSELEVAELTKIGDKIRNSPRSAPEDVVSVIKELCNKHFLTTAQIITYLGRSRGLVQGYLTQMVHSGDLILQYPERPTHPKQSYKTKQE